MRKNEAGQTYSFMALQADGTAVTTGVTGRRRLDTTAAAAITGTLTHLGTPDGWWEFAPSQADTNGDFCKYAFSGGSMVPVSMSFDTRNWQADVLAWAGNTGSVKNGATSGLPQVDMEAVADDPPSAQNFKDFCLEGYDPAANKVNGVKLTDTTTDVTNTVGANVTHWQGIPQVAVNGKPNVHVSEFANGLTADANVVQWQGFAIPGAVMIEDDGSGDGRFTEKALEMGPIGGVGNLISGQWRFNTATAAADPGVFRVALSNATPSAASFIYINESEVGGANASAVFNTLLSGDQIILMVDGDSAVYHRYTLTDVGTDNGAWWTFPVNHNEGNGTFTNLQLLNVGFVETRGESVTPDDVWKYAVDGTVTAEQSMRLQNSAAGAKTSGSPTTSFQIRDLADSKNRVTATVDSNGNRTVVVRDLT